MKKILKIIGYILAGLILILITSALLIRFVFKEQMIAYTSKLEEKEHPFPVPPWQDWSFIQSGLQSYAGGTAVLPYRD